MTSPLTSFARQLLFVGGAACCLVACSRHHAGGADGGVDGSANPDGSTGADGGSASGWDYAKIGGGGFVTGGTVAADGTKFFRTDTSGGYLYDDTTGRFSQVVPRNLPAAANIYWNGGGVFEAMIAGSDSKVLYAAYGDGLYRSTDRGASFVAVKTGLTFDSNGGGLRTQERHGQIDPQNPDHVLFGDGVALYRTTDGGATWQAASGVTSAAVGSDPAGFTGVAFNPKSALVGGRSSEAIVSSGGAFYRTTDGGDTWTNISSGGPNDAAEMAEFDANGRYFVALASTGGLWRYGGAAWKDLKNDGSSNTTFFIDPTNSNRVVVNRSFQLAWRVSTDGGDTWGAENGTTPLQQSVDGIPWHSTMPHYYNANLLLDAARGVLWLPGGNQGVASIPLSRLTGPTPFTADMHGIGIEQLCLNVLVAPKGSKKLHAAVWDESYAELDRDNLVYPSVVNDVGGLAASWGLDGSKENPKMLARWLSGPITKSGWTDDGGGTWHPFTTLPGGITSGDVYGYGGRVAYSGVDNIIITSSNTNSSNGMLRVPYYTLDRGATWQPVALPTAWTQANLNALHYAYYLSRVILVADHTKLGRFYFLVQSDDESFRGIYRTDDGGVTWSRTFSGLPGTQSAGTWTYNAHIESPVEGHLWMGAGQEDPTGQMGTGELFRSTDGGTTFTALPDVKEPANFGFGAPAHAGRYPVLFMEGYYKGVPGVWMSANADAPSPTWISLGATPNGQFAGPLFITGDPDVPGRVWVATGCDGAHVGEFGKLL